MKLDIKVFNTSLFVLLSWMLVGGSLYSVYESRFQEFLSNQEDISDQGLRITAAEIEGYLERRRHLLGLLVANNLDALKAAMAAPMDEQITQQISRTVSEYFVESLGFYLISSNNNTASAHQSPLTNLGSSCRADLEIFSQGAQLNRVFVHSNPDPKLFHIDILANVGTPNSADSGVLMVHLGTDVLRQKLANGQPYSHHFYLIRRTADNRQLIDVTADGVWPELSRSEFLGEQELDNAFAMRSVEGTDWQIVDFVAQDYVDEVRQGYLDSALMIGGLYWVLSCVFWVVFVLSERRKHAQEEQIHQLNDTLENLLRRRTDQLEQSKQMLSYQSSHDTLTGLINRKEFEYRLAETIVRAHEQTAFQSVILYIDIDHIKIINETCGLGAGDELLKQLAKSLFSLLRREDTLARIGGDEFGVLLNNCELIQAGLVARTLREQISQHGFDWEDRHFDISASIGIAEINSTTTDVSDLLRQVDAACFTAKEQGRNQVHVYHSEDTMFQTRRNEMYWQGEALRLMGLGRIVLYAQKIHPVSVEDPEPWYEVLVRLRDDDGKLVFPDKFIPALEQYGGIEKLDLEITRLAMQFLSSHPNMRLNINLSGKSIGNPDILQAITHFIDDYHIDAHSLVFEITETVAMVNIRQSRQFIESIKDLGCKMALDDFGSGMSSFSYLKNLDVDYVKLDGSFVRNLHEDPVHYEMVRSINGVTRVMGRQCIAEFVENEEITLALQDIGVAYAQGYHIHKPEPLSDINPLVIEMTDSVDIMLS